MAESVTVPLSSSQLAQFRQLVEARNQLNDRITALAEMIVLGSYTTERVRGQSLDVTNDGIVLTLNE